MENIELAVYSAHDLTVAEEVISRRTLPTLLEEHNRDGGGSFKIPANDELATEPNLLVEGKIIGVKVGGMLVGYWEIQKINSVLIDVGEASAEYREYSGPTVRNWLSHGIVLPWKSISPLDERFFNYAAPRGEWYVPADWKTPVKVRAVNPGPEKDAPKGWPLALHADWLWDKTGDAQVGEVYMRREFKTTGSQRAIRLVGTAADYMVVLIDGVRVFAVTEFASERRAFTADITLEPGDHILAIRARKDPEGTGGNSKRGGIALTVLNNVDERQVEDMQDIDRIIWTGDGGDWRINAYPAHPPGFTLGMILNILIQEARDRGVHAFNRIRTTFTSEKDSYGLPWETTVNPSFKVGIGLDEVVQQITDSYADVWLTPDFKLHMAKERNSGDDPLVFEKGRNVLGAGTQSTAEIANTAFLKSASGLVETVGPDTSLARYGRRETYLSAVNASTDGTMPYLTKQLFEKFAQPRRTPTLQIHPDDETLPWRDFNVGDWVMAPSDEDATKLVRRRVVSIALGEDADTGRPVYTVELDTIQDSIEARLARWLQELGNTSKSGGVSGTSSGSVAQGDIPVGNRDWTGTTPLPPPSLGQAPQPVTNVVASTDLYETPHGTQAGRIMMQWQHSGRDTTDMQVKIDRYEVWGRIQTPTEDFKLMEQVAGNESKAAVLSNLPVTRRDGTPLTYEVVVYAIASGGRRSAPSQAIATTMVVDTQAPEKPSKPSMSVTGMVLTLVWDFRDQFGNGQPIDFDHAVVEALQGDKWVEVSTLRLLGEQAVFVGTGYGIQRARIRAVDLTGNASEPSEEAVAETKRLVDTDLIISELDAAKTVITNAGEILLDRNTKLVTRLHNADLEMEAVREYAEQKNTELSGKLSLADKAIAETEKKLTGPGGLTERLAGAETKLSDVGALAYAEGQTLRQKLTAADSAISTAQGQVNTLRNTTIPKLNTDLTAAAGRITTAEGKITAAEGEITATKTELTAAKKLITDNKAIMDGAVTRLGAAESEITAAKTRLGTAETSINALRTTTIPKLTTDLSSAAGRIADAEQSLELIPGNIESAKAAAIADAAAKVAAAQAAAEADAKQKADKALADAKADATAKANAAQAAAITAADTAARATAKAEAEAAEARAAKTASDDAAAKAAAAQAAALAAAKTYADAQASGAGELALEQARTDAAALAEAARVAAVEAASLDATAKRELAEANAATEAQRKADKALADAKDDATAKAAAAQKAATEAASKDASTKANAARDVALAAAAAAEAAARRAMAAAVNVALDPGAETPEAWNFPSGGREYSIVSTEKRSGAKSLQILAKGSTASQSLWITPMDVPTRPGDIWEISAMVKTTADYNGTGANGKIRLAGPSGELLNAWTIPTATEWRKVGAEYTVPAGVNSIYVTVMSDHSKGTVWLDEFSVTNVTSVRAAMAAAEKAKQDAIKAAGEDAASRAAAVRTEALAAAEAAAQAARNAAGLAGTMGRAWFEPTAPPPGVTYNWEGARNLSPSVRLAGDGTVSAVNLHRNPGAVTSTDFHSWGGSNSTNASSNVQVAWSKSGYARRIEWKTVGSPTTGDIGVGIRSAVADPRIGFNNTFTVVAKVRGNRAGMELQQPSLYSSAAGTTKTTSRSALLRDMQPDQSYEVWVTGTITEAADTNVRMLFGHRTLQVGDAFEISDVMVYPGEYDPAREWFWGDSADDRANDLWIDTANGNTPKRWNSTEWVAVTDQAAIAAATAAAAADATAKADKAKADAIAAAADDATTKAEAARALAEKNAAADAERKTEAAKTALTNALTADAAAKIATAKQEALTAAAKDAGEKAEAARIAAEQASGDHAADLAATAQQAAIDAAATEAARVAGLAQQAAIDAARNSAVELANTAKTEAIDAAALDATFKADAAERAAKADAAAAKARADTAVVDAATAAGLADSKTKTLIQSAAPAAADRNSKVLWIDTTNNANTPKVWVAASNSWVARTDKVATDAAAVAAQAVTDAGNAAAAARTAKETADNALSAAGSKSTTFYSTSNPSGIAAVGDTWRKTDSSKNIIGEWRYVGGTNPWQAQLVTSEVISNLDVGKLTANTAVVNELVAQKIAAATASFQRVDAKNLFVTGTATLEEAVARRLAAETGTFMSLTTDQLTAGSANLKEAVAQKIAAATATFQKVTVENITASATANLNSVVAQRIAAGTASFQTVKVENITSTATANLNNVVAQRIAAGTASFQTVDAKNLFVTGTSSLGEAVAKRFAADTGAFIQLSVDQLNVSGNANFKEAVANKMFANMLTTNKITTQHMVVSNLGNMLANGNWQYGTQYWGSATNWSLQTGMGRVTQNFLRCTGITERTFGPMSNTIEVTEGDYYRISGWVRTNATSGSPRAELTWYWYAPDGTFLGNNNFNVDTAKADWTLHSHSVIAPPGATTLRVRLNATLSNTAQYMDFDDLTVALATDASLLVEGSVVAKHITASEEMSAKIGRFLTLDVVDLVSTGSAKIKDAVIEKLFTQTFSTRKLYANNIVVGQGGDLLGVPMNDSAWNDTSSVVNRYADGGRNGGPSILVSASTALVGSYCGIDAAERGKLPKLVPGGKYRLSAWFRGSGTIPAGGARLYLRFYPASTTNQDDWFFGPISSVGSEGITPPNTWKKIEGIFEVPDGAEVIGVPGVYTNTNTNLAVRFSDVVLQEAVTSELLVEGAVTAKSITASEELSAKAASFMLLTADKLLIGNGVNLIPDPHFDNWQRIVDLSTSPGTDSYVAGGGNRAIRYRNAAKDGYLYPLSFNNAGAADKAPWINCIAGETYAYSFNINAPKSQVTQWRVYSNVLLRDGSTQFVSDGWKTTSGEHTWEFTMPQYATKFGITFQAQVIDGTGGFVIYGGEKHRLVRMTDESLIVDGTIVTKKLKVTADMTAELLKAKKVEADEINLNSLTGDSGYITAMRTKVLTSNVITSDLIKSDAITSKHTLTGPLIRTAASGARTEMTNQGIRTLNAAGQELLRIGYGIETGMSVRNPGSGVLTPLSNVVFGGMVWTAPSRVFLAMADGVQAQATTVTQSLGYVATSDAAVMIASSNFWINYVDNGRPLVLPARSRMQMRLVPRKSGIATPAIRGMTIADMETFNRSADTSNNRSSVAWTCWFDGLVPGEVYDMSIWFSFVSRPRYMGIYRNSSNVLVAVEADLVQNWMDASTHPSAVILPR